MLWKFWNNNSQIDNWMWRTELQLYVFKNGTIAPKTKENGSTNPKFVYESVYWAGLGRDGIFKNGIFIYVAYYSGLHLIFQLNVV